MMLAILHQSSVSEKARVSLDPDPFKTTTNISAGSFEGRIDEECGTRVITFGISCKHEDCSSKTVEGFRITSSKGWNVVEMQYYNQRFDIEVESLSRSWVGLCRLLLDGFWILLLWAMLKRLLRTLMKDCRRTGNVFRLIKTDTGYVIGGTLCYHRTLAPLRQLEACWDGDVLLAEDEGGWRQFVKLMKIRFTKFIARWFATFTRSMANRWQIYADQVRYEAVSTFDGISRTHL